jgi:hypothetical protein
MYLTNEEGGGGIEPDPLGSGHCHRVHLLRAAQSGSVLNYHRHPDWGNIYYRAGETLKARHGS